jgi:hypothetical protein
MKLSIRSLVLPEIKLISATRMIDPRGYFAETYVAHFSYIQQMACTATWPRFGDPNSADIEEYLKVAPEPNAIEPRLTLQLILFGCELLLSTVATLILKLSETPEQRSP